MKFLVVLGICLLFVAVIECHDHHDADHYDGDHHDGDRHHDRGEVCEYNDDGDVKQFRCKECCGEVGQQYCCDDDWDSDDDDEHHKFHHKKMAFVVGGLAALIFIAMTVSCCIFYMKYKRQQAARLRPEFSGAVTNEKPTAPPSMPTVYPSDKKSPLPAGDVFTGDMKPSHDISVVISAPPPYETKY